MLFNSLHFLIFFPIVTVLFFALPHRFRWAMLLAASCYFYMVFRPIYIFILIFTIIVDYSAGILIEQAAPERRKSYLLLSLGANLGVLTFFKYFNFLNGSMQSFFAPLRIHYPIPHLGILLPIGLSFHVFQSLSYTIEVYRGRFQAERHPGILALYVMFYPQLVAGPIERPQNLLHQFHEEHFFDHARVVSGLELMLWGFFKKVLIADRLAPFVNQVYDHPHSYQGISFAVATVFFAFQIYCDFSGYSDIALGAAEVMGFRLMKNFNRPYFSKSIAEFWKRWHISLSTWFRDYLYIPLGGSRVSMPRWYFNVFFTFLVSGLWHGANWTFVIWGALNGVYLILEILMESVCKPVFAYPFAETVWQSRPMQLLRVGYTFSLICFSWVFFRANNVSDAFYVVRHFFDGTGRLLTDLHSAPFIKMNILMQQDKTEFLTALVCLAILLSVHLIQSRTSMRELIARQNIWLRWGIYYATIGAILFFGAFNSAQRFIYFQF